MTHPGTGTAYPRGPSPKPGAALTGTGTSLALGASPLRRGRTPRTRGGCPRVRYPGMGKAPRYRPGPVP